MFWLLLHFSKSTLNKQEQNLIQHFNIRIYWTFLFYEEDVMDIPDIIRQDAIDIN